MNRRRRGAAVAHGTDTVEDAGLDRDEKADREDTSSNLLQAARERSTVAVGRRGGSCRRKRRRRCTSRTGSDPVRLRDRAIDVGAEVGQPVEAPAG